MSGRLPWEIQDRAGLTSTEKLILMHLAWHGDDDGGNVFPSIATISSYSGLSERTVQRTLRGLEERELLVCVDEAKQDDGDKPDGNKARQYQIDLGMLQHLPLCDAAQKRLERRKRKAKQARQRARAQAERQAKADGSAGADTGDTVTPVGGDKVSPEGCHDDTRGVSWCHPTLSDTYSNTNSESGAAAGSAGGGQPAADAGTENGDTEPIEPAKAAKERARAATSEARDLWQGSQEALIQGLSADRAIPLEEARRLHTAWFGQVVCVRGNADGLDLNAPTSSIAAYLRKEFGETVERVIGREVRFIFDARVASSVRRHREKQRA